MAFGDSITVGDPANRAVSYPAFLESLLRQRYASQASNIQVINAGAGGERLLDGLLRLDSELDAHRPDTVLLMEGVNDLLSLGPDLSATVLQSMAQRAMSRNARVFLGSMIPTVPGRRLSQPVAQLLQVNSRLEAMARQQGAVYVDLYTPLLPDADAIIGGDGLHPTEAGYRRIAQLFLAAIGTDLEIR